MGETIAFDRNAIQILVQIGFSARFLFNLRVADAYFCSSWITVGSAGRVGRAR
jgi:hypothetical protein